MSKLLVKNQIIIYERSDDTGLFIDDETDVTLFLGPTGTGKSRLINIIFGEPVAKSELSSQSCTKEIIFYYGKVSNKISTNKKICLIDTVGLCDSVLTPDQIYQLLKDRINYVKKINKVFVTLGHRNEKNHFAGVCDIFEKLNLKLNPHCVFFFITKCDGMTDEAKNKLMNDYTNDYSHFMGKVSCIELPSNKELELDKIDAVGFPDSSIYIEKFLNALKDEINIDYNKLIYKFSISNPGVNIHQTIIEKYCTIL